MKTSSKQWKAKVDNGIDGQAHVVFTEWGVRQDWPVGHDIHSVSRLTCWAWHLFDFNYSTTAISSSQAKLKWMKIKHHNKGAYELRVNLSYIINKLNKMKRATNCLSKTLRSTNVITLPPNNIYSKSNAEFCGM